MCEFVGMDFEMEIKQHYHEVLAVLGDWSAKHTARTHALPSLLRTASI